MVDDHLLSIANRVLVFNQVYIFALTFSLPYVFFAWSNFHDPINGMVIQVAKEKPLNNAAGFIFVRKKPAKQDKWA